MNDLGNQILLNYRIFREYVVIKNLNLTHDILEEALFPQLLVPYPLDFTQQKFQSWDQVGGEETVNYDKLSFAVSSGSDQNLDDAKMQDYVKIATQF